MTGTLANVVIGAFMAVTAALLFIMLLGTFAHVRTLYGNRRRTPPTQGITVWEVMCDNPDVDMAVVLEARWVQEGLIQPEPRSGEWVCLSVGAAWVPYR